MFTRSKFDDACQAFQERHPQWAWVDGQRPGYGFLTRKTMHSRKPPPDLTEAVEIADIDDEPDDPSTAQPVSYSAVDVTEYIVYSASFSVPAFYFTIHGSSALSVERFLGSAHTKSDGSPLSLNEIIETSLFKIKPPRDSDVNGFALTVPSTPFPLLSQGDHPTLGTPCWYFHPCETERAVNEFMEEDDRPSWTEEKRLTRWLELWLMIVGSILNV